MSRSCVCGDHREMERFENETFTVDYLDLHSDVPGLSGWRCGACGEIEFDAESATRYAKAGDELVLIERRRVGENLKRIRKQLGLTQAEAERLTGGGHNAFSRYEKGVRPVQAVITLFELLDRHPELLSEVQPPHHVQDHHEVPRKRVCA
jgi:HTH-type transcriptional regulator/antitoxin MqsA